VAVVLVGAFVLVATVLVLPSLPTSRESRAVGQARAAFAPRVLAILGVGFLVFAAIQSALTYLVPFLGTVTGVTGAAVSPYLLAYGVATAIGSYAGGRFADTNAPRALVVGSIGVTVSLATMWLLGGNAVVAAVTVVGTGLFAMGMAPSIQHRVVTLAGAGAPLASSLPASAVNAGIAVGSFAGGLAIDASGVPAAVLTGATVGVLAVVAAWATGHITPAPQSAPAELSTHR
jgi:DHA1 family inner membrane transport protein